MRTPRLIVTLLGLLVIAAGAYFGYTRFIGGPTSERRPRIKRVLLLTIDTLRADALPFYGNDGVRAPSLSRLARDGVVFERTLAPSPWTRPSVATLLTGLPPDVHGFTDRVFDVQPAIAKGVRTLAQRFTDAGYKTAAIGYNPFLANSANLRRGFRDFVFYPQLGQTADIEARSTEIVTEETETWIAANGREDFFLWVHLFDPHFPYRPAKRYYRPVPGVKPIEDYAQAVDRFNGAMAATMALSQEAAKRGEASPVPALQPQDRALVRSFYDGEVRYVDDAVGRVLAALEKAGILDETLIVFTSDHGEEFFEHEGIEHGHSVHRELLEVPLVIRMPTGGAKARRVPGTVSLMNVLPTILDLSGLPPAGAQTQWPSLGDVVTEGAPAPALKRFVAGHCLYGEEQRAIVFDGKKYIRWEKSGREALFDLGADPGELTDVAAREPAQVAGGRERLAAYDAWAGGLRELLAIRRLEPGAEMSDKARALLRKHGYLR